MLHIDVDVYKPSAAILTNLFEKVVKGGIVVFDDYVTVAGETKAIDEYFDGQDYQNEKLSISHIPSLIKKSNFMTNTW